MKFKISVNDFQYAMRMVKDVVSTSSPLLENGGVLIKASEDRAVFTAFNPGMVAKVTVKIDGAEEGLAVVDAATLNSAISRFQAKNEKGVGTDDIAVSVSHKTRKVTISTKTTYANGITTPHKRVFPLLNHEFFPNMVEMFDTGPEADALTIPAAIIMDGIDCVSYALSTDKNNMVFTGIYFLAEPGKGFTFTATNGICLSEYKIPYDYEGPEIKTIIPGNVAVKISSSFFDSDDLLVKIGKRKISVNTPNLLIGGPLIQGDYPDYKSVLPNPDKFITLNKAVLTDNLINLNYEAANVEDNRVVFVSEGGDVCLSCGESENTGISSEGYSGQLRFETNLKLFILSMKNLTGEDLKIGFVDSESPIYFMSTDTFANGANLKCVVVPLT